MPYYNNLEIAELPADFARVIEFRMYLDSVEEIISLRYRVSKPPRYVKLTPYLFNSWESWVQIYEDNKNSINYKEDTSIRPLGEMIAPNWVKHEFSSYEEFYKHYIDLLNIGDLNGEQIQDDIHS